MRTLHCVIFDLDGTLADVTHRRHYVEGKTGKKDFPAFHAASSNDVPNEAVAWLFRAVRNTRSPIGSPPPWGDRTTDAFPVPVICTGRPEEYRQQTEAWLLRHCITPYALHMRRTGDFRPDAVIKREMYVTLRLSGFRPLFAVDDRDSVVKMWRDLGLTCMQVAEGNF